MPIPTKRILVIDDEAHIREIVQTCLEAIGGWDVITASNAQDGLRKALAGTLDAIVLDVMMPEIDGMLFLERLNADSTSLIPVVLLTAKAYLTESQQINKLGVAGAIAKPFNPMLLADQIAEVLQWG